MLAEGANPAAHQRRIRRMMCRLKGPPGSSAIAGDRSTLCRRTEPARVCLAFHSCLGILVAWIGAADDAAARIGDCLVRSDQRRPGATESPASRKIAKYRQLALTIRQVGPAPTRTRPVSAAFRPHPQNRQQHRRRHPHRHRRRRQEPRRPGSRQGRHRRGHRDRLSIPTTP
jgi:hypothetical protein